MIEERIGISLNADMIDGSMERFDEHLGYVERSGARWAELILHGMDVVVNGSLDPVQLKTVREITARHALGYTLHLPFILNLLDHNREQEFSAVFRAGLRFASELEIPVVVYHASSANLSAAELESHYYRRYGRKYREDIWHSLLEEEATALSEMADLAGRLGVRIGVENPNRSDIADVYTYGAFPDDLTRRVALIGHKSLGITLDFGHLYLTSLRFGFDYLGGVETLAKGAIHAHIHDNFGKGDAGEPYIQRLPYGAGDLHLPPGAGTAPLGPALKLLAAARYSGVLMLEIEFRMYRRFAEHVSAASALFHASGFGT